MKNKVNVELKIFNALTSAINIFENDLEKLILTHKKMEQSKTKFKLSLLRPLNEISNDVLKLCLKNGFKVAPNKWSTKALNLITSIEGLKADLDYHLDSLNFYIKEKDNKNIIKTKLELSSIVEELKLYEVKK